MVYACRVQKSARSSTYQSALDSARVEPALLAAAAEAKEVGAIVVVLLWLWGRQVACEVLSIPKVLVRGCGNTIGTGAAGWDDIDFAAALGWEGGRIMHGEVVVQASGRCSSRVRVRAEKT
jgi:hypothetical protein